MNKYKITGMSCAACSARVEKAVSKVDGVTQCNVNLLTESMVVEGTASDSAILKAVVDAGYGASADGKEKVKNDKEDIKNNTAKNILNRFIVSFIFLAVLMYISMGHTMWGWAVPSFIDMHINPIGTGLIELVLTAVIMVINQKFFISGFKGLIHRAPNMDTLVALGSSASFIYSLVILFIMSVKFSAGLYDDAMHYVHDLYFESAGTILTLITLGKYLETYSKGKTTNALKQLASLAPKTAVVIRKDKEVTVNVDEVITGDIFVVKPGESIPVDGVVIEGYSAVDESALTGESIPVDKNVDDKVSSATINKSGYLKCRATAVGQDTTLSKIIQMVTDASATKAPIAKIADKVSGVFVPAVIAISIVTFIVWMIAQVYFGYALSRAISVLVISCPCALGLATPVAIMVGNGVGAKNNILFKTAESLEQTGKTHIVVFDKTGTLTQGKPSVTDVVKYSDMLLPYAYSIENKSEHPLAEAIVEYSESNKVKLLECTDFTSLTGSGLKGIVDNKTILAGSYRFISSKINISNQVTDKVNQFADEGKTPLLFACDDELLGIIAVADKIKDDSISAVNELKNMGIRVVMLTGDNKRTADAIGKQLGVDRIISDVMPDDKANVIKELKQFGRVAMVGDGINDAPALTQADIGLAVAQGTDIAIDSADVVLMNSKPSDVCSAIKLSRRTLVNIKENLFWAFIYNAIGIPLAAGVWIPITGWTLNPMFGAAAMSLSSFCVVMNALRLNTVNIHKKADKNKYIKNLVDINIANKEEKTLTKTIKIDGMMCPHCEATVKKTLESIDGVAEAVASHIDKIAVVTLTKDVDTTVLEKAVIDAGYTVIE